MPERDKYGNYVNDEGVIIKITEDKKGNDHISFYDGEVDEPHDAVHININYNEEKWNSISHNADKSDYSNGSGGCYLTSACMKHMQENFDDNCEELTTLRWFRDKYVSKEDITHYYKVAPVIVKRIDELEGNEKIYNYIYENVVAICVNAIKNGDFEFAYNRYKNSVLSLENQFINKEYEKESPKVLKKVK